MFVFTVLIFTRKFVPFENLKQVGFRIYVEYSAMFCLTSTLHFTFSYNIYKD